MNEIIEKALKINCITINYKTYNNILFHFYVFC